MSTLKLQYARFDEVRAERAKAVDIAETLMAEARELKRQAINAKNEELTDDERDVIINAIEAKREAIRAAKEPIFPLAEEESQLAKAVSGKPRPE